jgi:hypothetical protein
MPPKKKTLTDRRQRSIERERKRTVRENESDSETEDRRRQDSERRAISRERETEEESSLRKQKDAEKHAVYREKETEEESSLRKQKDAEKHAAYREKETEEESSLRKQKDAEKHVAYRVQETEEKSSLRKQKDAGKHAAYREQETEEESSLRKLKVAERHSKVREEETEEEILRRRQSDSDRKFQLRQKESDKERRERLDRAKQRKNIRSKSTHNIGLKESDVEQHYIGPMVEICTECQSINFKDEKPSDGKFSSCCHKGKVELEPLEPYPEFLKELLTDKTNHSHKNFFENIRSYNSALAFASMGASISQPPGHGPYCFRIHGQIYHRVSPLHSQESDSPRFAQLYILDSDEALDKRMSIKENERCDSKLMGELDFLIRQINKYAEAYKMMREVELEEEQRAVKEGRSMNPISMILRSDRRVDLRRYNAPRINEVAIVFRNILIEIFKYIPEVTRKLYVSLCWIRIAIQ